MQTSFVIDVDEETFETDVIQRSHQTPVVVDFWAEWCGPCRQLGPTLENLAVEGNGAFILARLDVDDNPNLSMRYRVQGIPAVKVFRNGEVVDEFVGALPEPKVREFLKHIAPTEADKALEDAKSLLATRHWAEAEEAFRDVLDSHIDHPLATLGLVQALLAQGKGDAALAYIEGFPNSDEIMQAQTLQPLAELMAEVEREPAPQDDLEALYFNAARLLGAGKFAPGMDGFLDVLRADKRYRKDQARKVMLSIFVLLSEDDPLTQSYRRELGSVLF